MTTTPPPTVADGAWTSLRLPWDRDTDPLADAWLGEAEQLIGRLVDIGGSDTALATLFDPDQTPSSWIPWIAQLAGVDLVDVDTDTHRRRKIKEAPQRLRGTREALRAAARRYMTGDRIVTIVERRTSADTADPDHVWVRTYDPETPDPQRVEKALDRAKPAGIVVDYESRVGQTWSDVIDRFATWADVLDEYTDWEAVINDIPPEA